MNLRTPEIQKKRVFVDLDLEEGPPMRLLHLVELIHGLRSRRPTERMINDHLTRLEKGARRQTCPYYRDSRRQQRRTIAPRPKGPVPERIDHQRIIQQQGVNNLALVLHDLRMILGYSNRRRKNRNDNLDPPRYRDWSYF